MKKPYINRIHVILEAIGYLLCLVSMIFAIVKMVLTEGEIPTHFNMQGEVDGYGSASSLLFLPLVMIGVMALITLCLHLLPATMWNTGFKINPGKENIVRSDYAYMMTAMFPQIGLFTLICTLFFTKSGTILLVASGAMCATSFITIIFFIIKAFRDNRA